MSFRVSPIIRQSMTATTTTTTLPSMSGAATVHASTFPVLSFLHVPGTMKEPVWLMMGTAFLVDLQSFYSNTPTQKPPHRFTLLTAQHTFVPWKYVTDASQLSIPESFRRPRYVIGKLYLPDPHTGRANPLCCADLQLLSLHPSLDVALLSVRETGGSKTNKNSNSPASTSGTGAKAAVTGEIPAQLEERLIACQQSASLVLSPTDAAVGSRISVEGYRGSGRLGEEDTMDPAAIQKLSKAEQDALIMEMRAVQGKQEPAVADLEVLDARGMGALRAGKCYHGMSGAPVIMNETIENMNTSSSSSSSINAEPLRRMCGGILYGKHPDSPQHIGYTPASEVSKWLQSVLFPSQPSVAKGEGKEGE